MAATIDNVEYTLRLGDVGTAIEVTITNARTDTAIDVSTATVKQIVLCRPNGTLTYHDADFVTDGTDGKILYQLEDGDLDVVGLWTISAHWEMPDGSMWTSEPVAARVKRPGVL